MGYTLRKHESYKQLYKKKRKTICLEMCRKHTTYQQVVKRGANVLYTARCSQDMHVWMCLVTKRSLAVLWNTNEWYVEKVCQILVLKKVIITMK